MQRRSAKVQFNQRKGGAHNIAIQQLQWDAMYIVQCPIGRKKDAYGDTQVFDKRNLLAQIMLGYFSSSEIN